jgi:predicted acyltransferase
MTSSSQRFLALDVLRGMTVCFMIIVNTPGNAATTYWPLLHANWNGFTPTDLVFPTFMFVVGNALSFVERKWTGLSSTQVFLTIFKRSAIIFLLGYFMYWFPFVHWNEQGNLELNPFSHTRIMGVLQRIALGYFFAALMIRFLKIQYVYLLAFLFLLSYWIILLLFGDGNDPFNMLTNSGTKLDLFLLGENHLYQGEDVAFDPEGVLSTLPAISNVIFGYAVGKWLQLKGTTWEGLKKLFLAGIIFIAIALLWNYVFPINKKLWTGSFVLLTVGIDCIIITALTYITDFIKQTKWTYFFEVFGKNPLFIYLLSELGVTLLYFFRVNEPKESLYKWLYSNVFQTAGDYLGSFLFAIAFMLVCWLAGYLLDKRKIYVRV